MAPNCGAEWYCKLLESFKHAYVVNQAMAYYVADSSKLLKTAPGTNKLLAIWQGQPW